MKLIQNSGIRVFKSVIPVPPRESVAVYDRFRRDVRLSKN